MKDEDVLFQQARDGSREAIAKLIESHLPGLRAFVSCHAGQVVKSKESITDIVQSTCREVLEALPTYACESERHFKNWLYQAALRKVVDRTRYWNAQRRDVSREVSLHQAADDVARGILDSLMTSGVTSVVERKESFDLIEAGLRKISKRQRDVIVMTKFMDLPREEVANHFRISDAALRALLYRAMESLREAIFGSGDRS